MFGMTGAGQIEVLKIHQQIGWHVGKRFVSDHNRAAAKKPMFIQREAVFVAVWKQEYAPALIQRFDKLAR